MNPRIAIYAIAVGFRPALVLTSDEVQHLTDSDREMLLELGVSPTLLQQLHAIACAAPAGTWRIDVEEQSIEPDADPA